MSSYTSLSIYTMCAVIVITSLSPSLYYVLRGHQEWPAASQSSRPAPHWHLFSLLCNTLGSVWATLAAAVCLGTYSMWDSIYLGVSQNSRALARALFVQLNDATRLSQPIVSILVNVLRTPTLRVLAMVSMFQLGVSWPRGVCSNK